MTPAGTATPVSVPKSAFSETHVSVASARTEIATIDFPEGGVTGVAPDL